MRSDILVGMGAADIWRNIRERQICDLEIELRGFGMGDRLQGKTVMITGAAHGMGEAIAKAFANESAALALLDIQSEPLADVAKRIKSVGSNVYKATVDVREAKPVADAIARIEQELGSIDVVVNSAGVGVYKPIDEITEDDWDTTFDVNAKGTFLVCRAIAPYMISRRRGLIINIASLATHMNGFERGTCYTASKYAVEGFSRCQRIELRPHGVNICSLSPGSTDTHFRGEPKGNPNWMVAEDVAAAALYIATQRDGVAVHQVAFSMSAEGW